MYRRLRLVVRRLTERFRTRRGRAILRAAIFVVGTIGAIVLILSAYLWIGIPSKTKEPLNIGVTFSVPYAIQLGLNWRETLTASLDDLGIRLFRIPAYWSRVEPSEGNFDWSEIDFQMDEIGRRNGTVTLAIGAKLPRWPECWIPSWALQKGKNGEQEARLRYLQAVVERYRNHPALGGWQVENEALFAFGVCPKPSWSFLKKEIQTVRLLDPTHSISTTDSGELSTWLRAGSVADRLGVSTYRKVRTMWEGTLSYWFIPSYWYARRADLAKPWVDDVYVSEFQMEPWGDNPLEVTPIADQLAFFSPDTMRKNFSYAERMQIPEISFWGVEWWWWMKTKHGDDRFWEIAKAFFEKH